MSWPVVALGDVCSINPRLPKDIDEEQEVTFLGMASVSENGYLLNQEKRILKETRKGFTYFEKGDILVAKITPCFENGKAVFLDQLESEIGFGSTEFHVLRPSSQLDGKYLFYIIWNPYFRIIAEKSMTGSAGQKRVPTDFFKNFKIPLPPLEEQKRIAAILDKVDAIRQKRQQAIELADEFLRSVFLDMFGDPVTNPKGWKVSELGDCCSLQGGYAFKSEDFSKTGIPLVKITNVHFENIDWSDRDFVPVVLLEQKSDFSLKEGDLIMAMTRPVIKSLNAVKVIEVKKQDLPCLLNQRVGRFKGFEKNFEKDFFKYFLYSSYFKNEVEKLCSVALQPNVSSKQIESIKCFIPPKDVQRKFSVIKQNVDKIISSFIPFSNMPLFESLSKKAFSGEL